MIPSRVATSKLLKGGIFYLDSAWFSDRSLRLKAKSIRSVMRGWKRVGNGNDVTEKEARAYLEQLFMNNPFQKP